jgi:5-(carboxyamino)imidazole ribonucleotide synthase
VLNLPLGKTDPVRPVAVMANLLGVSNSQDLLANRDKVMSLFPDVNIHFYGKAPRLGRKLGHITVVGDNADTCLRTAEAARNELNN